VTARSDRRTALFLQVMASLEEVAASVGGALLQGLSLEELSVARATCWPCFRAAGRPLTVALADVIASSGNTPQEQLRRVSALKSLAAVAASAGGDHHAAQFVASCLKDNGAGVRHAATKALLEAAEGLEGRFAQTAVEVLGPALADCDEKVSCAAAKALPRLVPRGDKAAVAVVLGHLQSRSPWVRRSALQVLGELGPRNNAAVVHAVADSLRSDQDWRSRIIAARTLPSLAERGNSEAASALEAALTDPEARVQQVAAGALAHLAVIPSMPFLDLKAKNWKSPVHRRPKRQASTPASASKIRRGAQEPCFASVQAKASGGRK